MTVQVQFVIGPDGLTYNPEIVGETPNDFVVPALVAVAGMQFKPVLKAGKSIYVRTALPLKFTEFKPSAVSESIGGEAMVVVGATVARPSSNQERARVSGGVGWLQVDVCGGSKRHGLPGRVGFDLPHH